MKHWAYKQHKPVWTRGIIYAFNLTLQSARQELWQMHCKYDTVVEVIWYFCNILTHTSIHTSKNNFTKNYLKRYTGSFTKWFSELHISFLYVVAGVFRTIVACPHWLSFPGLSRRHFNVFSYPKICLIPFSSQQDHFEAHMKQYVIVVRWMKFKESEKSIQNFIA